MKKALLIAGISCSMAMQAQTLDWAKQSGGENQDIGRTIITDAAGNVYTSGSFVGTVDFDPGAGVFNLVSETGNDILDIYISKLDASGNFVWAKRIGGQGYQQARALTLDASGNILLCGRLQGTADFDPGAGVMNLTATFGGDIFICKLNASGELVWAKQMGGDAQDYGFGIATDAAGNVYTTGHFTGTADFNPGSDVTELTSLGNLDIFVSKLTAAGNFVWTKQIGGTDADKAASMAVDAAGNVFVTGTFRGTCDFDPGNGNTSLTSGGEEDAFVMKLEASLGMFSWVKSFSGSDISYLYSVALDASGNVVVGGNFRGTADFDPGAGVVNLTTADEESDAVICKLDASGNLVWAKQIGGEDEQISFSVAFDMAGNVYTTGSFYSTVDFNPGNGVFNMTSAGEDDIFIGKLNAAGEFVWAVQLGGVDTDNGCAITVDAAGKVYSTGYFRGTADFDPQAGTFNMTATGVDIDAYVHRMTSPIEASGLAENDRLLLDIYPNPNAGSFQLKTAQAISVEVISMDGQLMLQRTLTPGTNTIEVGNVAAGLYLVRATAENGVTSVKHISIIK
jgi:hypothetical protein